MTNTAEPSVALEAWTSTIGEASQGKLIVIYDRSEGHDLTHAFAAYWTRAKAKRENYPIPLFVSPLPAVHAQAGWTVPREFVISVFNLKNLRLRSRQLTIIYPHGIPIELLRSFAVGRFRRYLGLDDDNHGRGELDTQRFRPPKPDLSRQLRGGPTWPDVYAQQLCLDGVPLRDADIGVVFRELFQQEWHRALEGMQAIETAAMVFTRAKS